MADNDSQRRRFLGICSQFLGMAAIAPQVLAATDRQTLKAYPRTLLVDRAGDALDCQRLEREQEYVFHYPYQTTPCFLIDLGRKLEGGARLATEGGDSYTWPGGTGPQGSLVAFSAICAHRMTHPSPEVSFIGYRRQPVGFLDDELNIQRRSGVIQCCSEGSVYDPAEGARVLGGPAPQPLAAIALDFDGDRLYATGVYGGTLFDSFFDKFANRLITEYRTLDIKQPSGETAEVASIVEFTRRKIECS